MNYIKFLPYILALAAYAALGAGFVYRGLTIKTLEAQATTLQTQLTVSETSVKQLMTSVDTQNNAIDKLKSDADKRVAANSEALAIAKRARNSADLTAKQILAIPLQPDANKCDAANEIINKVLK